MCVCSLLNRFACAPLLHVSFLFSFFFPSVLVLAFSRLLKCQPVPHSSRGLWRLLDHPAVRRGGPTNDGLIFKLLFPLGELGMLRIFRKPWEYGRIFRKSCDYVQLSCKQYRWRLRLAAKCLVAIFNHHLHLPDLAATRSPCSAKNFPKIANPLLQTSPDLNSRSSELEGEFATSGSHNCRVHAISTMA